MPTRSFTIILFHQLRVIFYRPDYTCSPASSVTFLVSKGHSLLHIVLHGVGWWSVIFIKIFKFVIQLKEFKRNIWMTKITKTQMTSYDRLHSVFCHIFSMSFFFKLSHSINKSKRQEWRDDIVRKNVWCSYGVLPMHAGHSYCMM